MRSGFIGKKACVLFEEAFSLDRRGWKAAPTGKMPACLEEPISGCYASSLPKH
jgi:hypothetical protein